MVIVPVLVFLGILYWVAILASLSVALLLAPRGRRVKAVACVAAVEGALVAAAGFVPAVGMCVWFPIVCVAMLPVVVVCQAVGVDLAG